MHTASTIDQYADDDESKGEDSDYAYDMWHDNATDEEIQEVIFGKKTKE